MLKLSIEEIIKRIEKEEIFEAEARDQSFRIKIKNYVPYVCTAIHDGNNFRDELKLKSVLTDYERWYEEDPFTAEFISSMPITLVGQDSRFEYDLNRAPQTAVYETAWGKKVWRKPLTKAEKQRSLAKHTNFYRVTEALVAKIESLFEGCVVYDMHSYNYQRWDRPVPVFNIGTERIDNKRYGGIVQRWQEELDKIEIPNVDSHAAINDVFQGKGYNLQFITERFDKTLVLATEVSKIYCDELSGEAYPAVISDVREQLKSAIVNHAHFFSKEFTSWEKKRSKLLGSNLEASVLKVDRELYRLLKDFELLNFVNPVNFDVEKKKFFDSRCTENPEFEYQQIRFDPFEMKRDLHRVEIEKISDINIQNMYNSVIHAFVDKTEMLDTLGTETFHYNSMRYFGAPNTTDVNNAKFLLHAPTINVALNREPKIGVDEAVKLFKKSFDEYGFKGKIEISNKSISSAMVMNHQKKVVLRKGAMFTPKELRFLEHHEIGVHMVTTMNSNLQPLKVFNLGHPVNTKTQEGLAVLSEYLSGNMTQKRLRMLALRVISIELLNKGADFKKNFRHLVNEYGMDLNDAFFLVTRVYRGGGFTKDFLYLRGFGDIYKFWKQGNDLSPLLIGKTSLEYYDVVKEMIERGLLLKPKYITRAFVNPVLGEEAELFDYLIRGIK